MYVHAAASFCKTNVPNKHLFDLGTGRNDFARAHALLDNNNNCVSACASRPCATLLSSMAKTKHFIWTTSSHFPAIFNVKSTKICLFREMKLPGKYLTDLISSYVATTGRALI